MPAYRCPVCGKALSRSEYEKALRIHEARETHLDQLEADLRKREKGLTEKVKEARAQGINQERARSQRLLAGANQKVRHLEDRIRQLERGSTPQTEGLEFEEKLVARLQHVFPDDDIQHKGHQGDILHMVIHNRKTVGVIIYECKRTASLQSDHVQQTFRAKQSRHADFAVLVTTARKKTFGGLAEIDGVLVVSPLGVIPLTSLLRTYLIEMEKAQVTKDKRTVIGQNLLKYLASPQFKNPMGEIMQVASRLEDMIKDEAKDHFRVWQRRWRAYQTVQWDASQVRKNLDLLLEGKPIKELTAPKFLPLRLAAGQSE